MRLIKPSFEIWEQEPEIKGIYRQIEKTARTCYHSLDKMTESSYDHFTKHLIDRGHLSPFEHGTVYLKAPVNISGGMGSESDSCILDKYRTNKFSIVRKDNGVYPDFLYVTTNMRVLIENGWTEDLKYLCEPTEYHVRRYTVHFTADIGVLREFLRHRIISPMQESTRFCNYSMDKFDNELTFIIPCWYSLKEGHYEYVHETGPLGHDFHWTPEVSYQDLENGAGVFLDALSHSEVAYQEMMEKWDNRIHDKRFRTGYRGNPLTPQQAREVLPLATKSEAVMTGSTNAWINFFNQRCSFLAKTGKPHPQASELADPLYNEFVKRGYIKPLV